MTRSLLLLCSLFVVWATTSNAQQLLLCGRKTVHLVQLRGDPGDQQSVEFLWKWSAEECPQIPPAMRPAFATTDECKPIKNGSRILISSSSGGCALVEYPSGIALWFARVPNAHSIEMLPNNRIAVASSVHRDGNKVVLFDAAVSNQPLGEIPLLSGHGVVWDEGRQRLWAIGSDELISVRLHDWETKTPELVVDQRYPLPDKGGHDLLPVPGTINLIASTHNHVFLFNRDRQQFSPHPELGDRSHVKSVHIHPQSQRLAFIQANEQQWWSNTIELRQPAGNIELPEHDLYKARWFSPSH